MTFPTLAPSSRSFEPGNWAVKNYNAMSGAEIRIRYGDKRFNARLSLQYQNIAAYFENGKPLTVIPEMK